MNTINDKRYLYIIVDVILSGFLVSSGLDFLLIMKDLVDGSQNSINLYKLIIVIIVFSICSFISIWSFKFNRIIWNREVEKIFYFSILIQFLYYLLINGFDLFTQLTYGKLIVLGVLGFFIFFCFRKLSFYFTIRRSPESILIYKNDGMGFENPIGIRFWKSYEKDRNK